jgi:hypothetical protein
MDFDLSIFATRFLGIFIEALPFLLLGTLASGLIEVFISKDDLTRLIPRNPIAATIMGGFMGFMFPVCECGVVPVTRRLFNKGLPMSVGIAFLLAAPVMNPVVVASTYAAFGLSPIFYGRFIMTAIVAISVGLVFNLQTRPQQILNPRGVILPLGGGTESAIPQAAAPKMSGGQVLAGLKRALLLAREEFFDMGKYLIFGSLLAALMGTLKLDQQIEGLASNPVNSVFVMQASAFVLSVCSTVDSFIALAFTGTFTTGSILAFLVFGPMADIKSTMMFVTIFKPRVVAYIIILPLLITALIAITLNLNVRF